MYMYKVCNLQDPVGSDKQSYSHELAQHYFRSSIASTSSDETETFFQLAELYRKTYNVDQSGYSVGSDSVGV